METAKVPLATTFPTQARPYPMERLKCNEGGGGRRCVQRGRQRQSRALGGFDNFAEDAELGNAASFAERLRALMCDNAFTTWRTTLCLAQPRPRFPYLTLGSCYYSIIYLL